jgi:glycosyltransferase involved in cell wall biosynthesis
MKLSVIVPSYNNGPELREAIQSVIAQEEIKSGSIDCEIIVVDDGSFPEFNTNLEGLPAEFGSLLTLIRMEKNSGPAAARNRGIKVSTGNWVGFVDADDRWTSNKLEKLLPLIREKKYEVVGGKVQYFSRNGAELPDIPFDDSENRVNHVHLGAILVRKEVFGKELFFNESLRFGEDTDWWIRIRENQLSIRLIEDVALEYHLHGGNMTAEKKKESRDMLKLIQLSLQRRRAGGKQVLEIPSIKEFAEHKESSDLVIFYWGAEGEIASGKKMENGLFEYNRVKDFSEGFQKSLSQNLSSLIYFSEKPDLEFAEKAELKLRENPYLGFFSGADQGGLVTDLIVKSKSIKQVFFGKDHPTGLPNLEDFLEEKGIKKGALS